MTPIDDYLDSGSFCVTHTEEIINIQQLLYNLVKANTANGSKKAVHFGLSQKETQVLLGLKKRGFGVGLWNGFGGKVESKETLIEAAVREMKEECGLTVKQKNLKHIGHLEISFQGDPVVMNVAVFNTLEINGQVTESDEMRPKWFDLKSVPFSEMWPDNRYWFDYILNDKQFIAKYWYKEHKQITHQSLREVNPEELASLLTR